jgi:A/G-specific adenine glycosylase
MSKFQNSLKQLATWFERQKRILPWRDDPSVYRVWVSEIMLQQTQVITVVPYFEKFMARFPTVEKLAEASEEEVMRFWAGLGYYSRARNLHRAAQKIVQQGRFPQTREEWLEIPGVGDYTAGAILSIASDLCEPILDGNLERVLSRVRRVSRQKGDVHFKERLWKLSGIFVQEAFQLKIRPSVLNQSLMELGATVCSPKKPRCLLCPIRDICRAYEWSEQESYPPKKKPKQWVHVQEKLHCLIHPSGKVLVRKRQEGEWRAGLWDLLEEEPQKLISPISSPVRELGCVDTRHVVTRHKIQRTTQVWTCASAWKSSESFSSQRKNEELRWISIHEPEVAVGSALKRTLKQILERYPVVS